MKLGSYLENIRRRSPLIHSITNYVTANDTANALLAVGARPIMADAPEEAQEVAGLCDGADYNLGTWSRERQKAILAAGRAAAGAGKPLVLDPVGAGSLSNRREAALELLSRVRFAVIRGNVSEIRALATGRMSAGGVDAAPPDAVTEENLADCVRMIEACAKELDCVLAVTGAVDIVSGGGRTILIRNGRPEMRQITGMGCMLSGITAACAAANPENLPEAAAAAVCMVGVAGEIAWERMCPGEGNASYRNRILDALCHLDGEMLDARASASVYSVSSERSG